MRPTTHEQNRIKKALALRQSSRVSLNITTTTTQNKQNDKKKVERLTISTPRTLLSPFASNKHPTANITATWSSTCSQLKKRRL